MRTWVPLSLAFLLAAIGCQVVAQQKLVMCYYTNWSQYRQGRKFFPEQIDPQHCTHLVYSFAKLVGNRLTTYEWNEILDYTDGLYKRFNALKRQKPGLKTLLAVGGFSARSEGFSAMASTAANRQEFVTTSIQWLRDNDFDGLDLDWEYPAHAEQGGRPEDRVNFVLLCQDLRKGFDAEAQATGRDTLMLTAAVAAGYSTVSNGYDIPNLNRYLDYINIMSYDLHGAWDSQTGHNAGLYTSSTDSARFSVAETAENWVSGGATRAKTLVGLATYGRTWTLADPTDTRVGASARGAGNRGQYSGEAGYLTYYEVCEVALNGGYTVEFDQESKVPYAHKGGQWITYDDVNSLQYKMTWLRNMGYAGAIVWAIELDDFDGNSCGAGKYPLMRAISSCLINGQSCAPGDGGVVTPPPTTTTTTTRVPITQQPTTQSPTTTFPTTRRPVYTRPPPTTRRPWYTRAPTTRRPIYTQPPTTRRPIYTQPPTTRRPVYTQPPTTRRPVYTQPPTTRRPVYTQPPTTRRPVYTRAPTTRQPVYSPPTTVTSGGLDAQCPAKYGFFRDLQDCGVFWFCYLPYRWRYVCPPGTQFDQRYYVCSHNSDCSYPLGLRG